MLKLLSVLTCLLRPGLIQKNNSFHSTRALEPLLTLQDGQNDQSVGKLYPLV